jgi:hypothetical protein
MKKFEYKLITLQAGHLSRKSFQAELDEKFRIWGDAGWELIKMEPITSGGMIFHGATTREFIVVFKREKVVN